MRAMRAHRQVVDRERETELAARVARPVEGLPCGHRTVREGPRDSRWLAGLLCGDRGNDHALPAPDGHPVRMGRHRGSREGSRSYGLVLLYRSHAGYQVACRACSSFVVHLGLVSDLLAIG